VTSITERLLGYILAPAARGRVCATKACEALLALAFGATDWTEVRAGVLLGNNPSLQGLAKLVSHETGRSGG
jgi:RimJ/RimL family protein N-acetyltransferase